MVSSGMLHVKDRRQADAQLRHTRTRRGEVGEVSEAPVSLNPQLLHIDDDGVLNVNGHRSAFPIAVPQYQYRASPETCTLHLAFPRQPLVALDLGRHSLLMWVMWVMWVMWRMQSIAPPYEATRCWPNDCPSLPCSWPFPSHPGDAQLRNSHEQHFAREFFGFATEKPPAQSAE